jgi:hypothetical protein
MQYVNADQSSQTRYKIGYNDGFKSAECDFKRCQGNAYDKTVPTGHTKPYNKQSPHNGTTNVNVTTTKSQQVPHNNNDVCDPTHQFCAMTKDID